MRDDTRQFVVKALQVAQPVQSRHLMMMAQNQKRSLAGNKSFTATSGVLAEEEGNEQTQSQIEDQKLKLNEDYGSASNAHLNVPSSDKTDDVHTA